MRSCAAATSTTPTRRHHWTLSLFVVLLFLSLASAATSPQNDCRGIQNRGSCERWFPRAYVQAGHHQPWYEHLCAHDPEGFAGCAAAISGTDFYTPTSGLRIPTLGIAGSEDGSTPPDLVRETTDLISGSQFRLLRGTGHVPPVDAPADYAACLGDFIAATGHLRTVP